MRHRPLGRFDAVDDGVEDHPRGYDHPGLKAPAGPEIAVQLHIEPEHEDERDEHLGADPQDGVEPHLSAPL